MHYPDAFVDFYADRAADSDTNPVPYENPHGHLDPNAHEYFYGDPDTHGNLDSYAHCDFDQNRDADDHFHLHSGSNLYSDPNAGSQLDRDQYLHHQPDTDQNLHLDADPDAYSASDPDAHPFTDRHFVAD